MTRPVHSTARALVGAALVSGVLAGCGEDTATLEEDPPATLEVGESRPAELRYLRFDVRGFEQAHTLEDLRAMPRRVLEDIWLLDLDVTPLVSNSLEQLRSLPPAEVDALPTSAQNMQRLLTLTPDNIRLEGTNLEALAGLSGAVGIPPARAFANLLGIGVTDDFVPPDIMADALLDHVIGSHPAATTRLGPIDEEHPDGVYAVAPRSIPVTLADVVTNFENMAERFGPSGDHPGFVVEAHGVSVIEEEFQMISKVNVNALPFKGVDLTNGEVASVNSIGAQIETLHDFSDPDWMQLEGLVANPTIETLGFAVVEHDGFVPGGTQIDPPMQGDSPAWDLPHWEFEHMLVQMARAVAETVPAHCDSYTLATGANAFTACIDERGWVELETFNDVGTPPAPSYLWDIDLELGQARLHDGGLAEGEADVELVVHDLEVGVPAEELIEQAKANVKANPEALREFASLLVDNTIGAADFYYVRGEDGRDWLYFVSEADIAIDEEGDPVRPYAYVQPGFFSDPGLQRKVSSVEEVDGDTEHEKVQVDPGDTVFVGDDQGRVFEVEVLDKPGRARVSVVLTRVD